MAVSVRDIRQPGSGTYRRAYRDAEQQQQPPSGWNGISHLQARNREESLVSTPRLLPADACFFSFSSSSRAMGSMMAPSFVTTRGLTIFFTVRPIGERMVLSNCAWFWKGKGSALTWWRLMERFLFSDMMTLGRCWSFRSGGGAALVRNLLRLLRDGLRPVPPHSPHPGSVRSTALGFPAASCRLLSWRKSETTSSPAKASLMSPRWSVFSESSGCLRSPCWWRSRRQLLRLCGRSSRLNAGRRLTEDLHVVQRPDPDHVFLQPSCSGRLGLLGLLADFCSPEEQAGELCELFLLIRVLCCRRCCRRCILLLLVRRYHRCFESLLSLLSLTQFPPAVKLSEEHFLFRLLNNLLLLLLLYNCISRLLSCEVDRVFHLLFCGFFRELPSHPGV
ncbi:hypothetical protein EYF80_033459 [Liparis tanakae]|uniref:Uncharacterized protein n=1 Tax=Liparis tanakae TaxID=230148 RepID=A0A4Z2GRR5_9TELE|nr:hypothetical protein EYF80_033459 [Liparis tanakae]